MGLMVVRKRRHGRWGALVGIMTWYILGGIYLIMLLKLRWRRIPLTVSVTPRATDVVTVFVAVIHFGQWRETRR